MQDRWDDDRLEREIERPANDFARKRGWVHVKIMRASLRGWPDDYYVRAGVRFWIEFKAPGEEPSPQQAKRHRELREQGDTVHVIDSLEDAVVLLT